MFQLQNRVPRVQVLLPLPVIFGFGKRFPKPVFVFYTINYAKKKADTFASAFILHLHVLYPFIYIITLGQFCFGISPVINMNKIRIGNTNLK